MSVMPSAVKTNAVLIDTRSGLSLFTKPFASFTTVG